MYLSKCILKHFSKKPVPSSTRLSREFMEEKKVKNIGRG